MGGLFVGVLVCWAAVASAHGTWSKRVTSGPALSARSTPAAANITQARYAGAAGQIGLSFYVQGGDLPGGAGGCGSSFPHHVTSELWRYSLLHRASERVVPAGDALPRLKRTVAATVGTRMYVFAGFDFACTDEVGGQVWNEGVYSYSPVNTPWPAPALPVRPGPGAQGPGSN